MCGSRVRTLYDCFTVGVTKSGNGVCLGYRRDGRSEYTWISYSTVLDEARAVGAGIKHAGVQPGARVHTHIICVQAPIRMWVSTRAIDRNGSRRHSAA
jgi:hypothetical protein